MMMKGVRKTYLLGFVFVFFLLCGAYYLEYGLKIIPCSLCILQRLVMIGLGSLFLLASLLVVNRMSGIIFGTLSLVICLTGLALSARQVWIQHTPPEGFGECGMNFETLFKFYDPLTALSFIWKGGVECSQYSWTLFNLSLAEWSLISFIVCFFLILYQWIRIFR